MDSLHPGSQLTPGGRGAPPPLGRWSPPVASDPNKYDGITTCKRASDNYKDHGLMPIRDVPFPAELADRLPTKEDVLAHRASDLSGSRWARAIEEAALPAPTGAMATDGAFSLDRAEILDLASREITEDNALQLLYSSLAWGLGSKGFRMASKMRGIGQTDVAVLKATLVEAWAAVREGRTPQRCYEVLLSQKGRPRIKQLGAAFATKYLYFAAGDEAPTTPILDAVVATSLRPLAWEQAPTTAWWSSTYANYCELLTRWADEAGQLTGAPVRLDQIEKMLFSLRH